MIRRPAPVFYALSGVVVTLVFLALFLRGVDWGGVQALLQECRWPYVAAAVLALLPGHFARLWRWRYLLRPESPGLRLRDCLVPYLSAFAINNVLPFRAGDIVRVALFNRQLGASPAAITSSLLLERILDFAVLLLMLLMGVFWLVPDQVNTPVLRYVFTVAALVFVAGAVTLFYAARLHAVLDAWHRHSQVRRRPWLYAGVGFLRHAVRSAYRHGHCRAVATLLMASLLIWTAEILLFFLVAAALDISLVGLQSALVMSVSTLASLLPSTPGYVGTFHYLCRVALEWVGVVASHAVGFALLVHLVLVLPITVLGGLAFLHHFGKASWRRLAEGLARAQRDVE